MVKSCKRKMCKLEFNAIAKVIDSHFESAAASLGVSTEELASACQEYGIHRWSHAVNLKNIRPKLLLPKVELQPNTEQHSLQKNALNLYQDSNNKVELNNIEPMRFDEHVEESENDHRLLMEALEIAVEDDNNQVLDPEYRFENDLNISIYE